MDGRTGQVVALHAYSEQRERAGHETTPLRQIPTPPPAAPAHLHQWDCDVALGAVNDSLATELGQRASGRLVVRLDRATRGYAVTVYHAAWDAHLVLRQAYRPGETAEQRISREAVLRFLNEVLSAMFGLPA